MLTSSIILRRYWRGAIPARAARGLRATSRCHAMFDDAFSTTPRRPREGDRDRRGRDRDRGDYRQRDRPGGADRRNGRYNRDDDDRRSGSRYDRNDRNSERNHNERRSYDSGDRFSSQDKKSAKLEFQGDTVYGSSPVLAALDANRRVLHTLYVQEGITDSKRKELPAIKQALAKAQKMNIPLVETSKHDLNMATSNRPHQGIVLDASPLGCEKLDVMPPVDTYLPHHSWPVWLCLDEIQDPQNLGAVIRTAFFLGADGVLICSKNSAPLSGVVSKASSGALEKMTVYSCRSLPTTLVDAKSKGWDVVAASGEADSTPCQEFELKAPTLLVMGSEGYGLRKTVRNACSRSIRVDRGMDRSRTSSYLAAPGMMDVESLNVSVATGILLHTLLHSKRT